MSNGININILKNFIVKTIGGDSITSDNARKYDIDTKDFDKANTNDDFNLDLDEIVNCDSLYEQFATMFEEFETEKTNSEEAKKEKDQIKTGGKSGAGV